MTRARSSDHFLKLIPVSVVYSYVKRYKDSWSVQENIDNLVINIALWVFLFITNMIDILVSYKAFSEGAVEINPFMAVIYHNFGIVGLAFYKGFLIGVMLVLLPVIKKRLRILFIFTCFVYAALTISHIMRF